MPPVAPSANFDPAVAHDVQLGQIFSNMRLAMKVSRETIARRLATSTFIIEAFETGTVSNLPHWRETARIVRGYCDLLRLDPEPILWRIKKPLSCERSPLGLLAHDGSRPAALNSSLAKMRPSSPRAHKRRPQAGSLMPAPSADGAVGGAVSSSCLPPFCWRRC